MLLASVLFMYVTLLVSTSFSRLAVAPAMLFWHVDVKIFRDHFAGAVSTTVWMIGTFALRQIYTGDIYSGLTQGYAPFGVPLKFEHLYNESEEIYRINDPLLVYTDADTGRHVLNGFWNVWHVT